MAGRGRGKARAAPEFQADPIATAAFKLQEDGDFSKFLESGAEDLNTRLEFKRFQFAIPFTSLVMGLTKTKRLTSPEGVADVRRAVSELGARWEGSAFVELLRGLVELRAVTEGRALVDFAIETGAAWVANMEHHVVFRDDVCFLVLLNKLLEAGTIDEPACRELLERSLTECGRPDIMKVLLEGGGTVFSELVSLLALYGVLDAPLGDELVSLAMRFGADWAGRDGWNQIPFEEVFRRALTGTRQRETKMSPEAAVAYLEKVLEKHQDPGFLWNGTTNRTDNGDKECTGALKVLVRYLAENRQIGQPISHAFLRLADRTGARWDTIHWNYMPPWGLGRAGYLTTFHSLINELGQAGALDHPLGVDLVARALENGADYRIDDSRPPGPGRFTLDIPSLIWERRRETVRLLALLASGRAQPRDSEPEDIGGKAVAACLVTLAAFVEAAKHSSAWKVEHPIVRSVMGFLPRVPPVMGYEFTDWQKTAHHPSAR